MLNSIALHLAEKVTCALVRQRSGELRVSDFLLKLLRDGEYQEAGECAKEAAHLLLNGKDGIFPRQGENISDFYRLVLASYEKGLREDELMKKWQKAHPENDGIMSYGEICEALKTELAP